MKWYVTVETQSDGKDYVGINEYYGGEETQEGFISLHDSEDEADQACAVYAQESGLPLFADYRQTKEMGKLVCSRCHCEVEEEKDDELKKEYPYYCPECDENLYSFETEEVKSEKASAVTPA
jgi:hypothetical protein